MKRLKFWLAGILFAALVVVMTVNINLKCGVTADSKDFVLINVEALAQGEGGFGDCFGSGSIVCEGGTYKVKVSR